MRMVVVAVHDSAAGAFGRPIFAATRGMALRSFVDEVNRSDADNPMWGHPDDYALWCLCEFEDGDGSFRPNPGGEKELMARGKDVRRDAQK